MRDGALSPLASLELLSSYNPNSALPLPKRAPKAQPFRLPRAIPASLELTDSAVLPERASRALEREQAGAQAQARQEPLAMRVYLGATNTPQKTESPISTFQQSQQLASEIFSLLSPP